MPLKPSPTEADLIDPSIQFKSPVLNMISMCPTDEPLNMEGELIHFWNFNHAARHLSQFMDEIVKYIPLVLQHDADLSKCFELIRYVEVISTCISNVHPEWKTFIAEFKDWNEKLSKKMRELQLNAKQMEKIKNDCSWMGAMNNLLSNNNSTIQPVDSSEGMESNEMIPSNFHPKSLVPPTEIKTKNNQPNDPDDDRSSSDSSDEDSKNSRDANEMK
jgi:hypothetical protein